MTRYDVGKLNRGDRVAVGGKLGTVTSPHEPEWIDHKTKAFQKEFQGADIQFDGEPGHSVYIHADSITILEANVKGHASPEHAPKIDQTASSASHAPSCSLSS